MNTQQSTSIGNASFVELASRLAIGGISVSEFFDGFQRLLAVTEARANELAKLNEFIAKSWEQKTASEKFTGEKSSAFGASTNSSLCDCAFCTVYRGKIKPMEPARTAIPDHMLQERVLKITQLGKGLANVKRVINRTAVNAQTPPEPFATLDKIRDLIATAQGYGFSIDPEMAAYFLHNRPSEYKVMSDFRQSGEIDKKPFQSHHCSDPVRHQDEQPDPLQVIKDLKTKLAAVEAENLELKRQVLKRPADHDRRSVPVGHPVIPTIARHGDNLVIQVDLPEGYEVTHNQDPTSGSLTRHTLTVSLISPSA